MSSPAALAPPRTAPPRDRADDFDLPDETPGEPDPAIDRAPQEPVEPVGESVDSERPAPADPVPTDDGRLDRIEKSRSRKLADAGVALLFVAAGVGALVVLLSMKTPAEPVDRVSPPPLVETVAVGTNEDGVDLSSDGVAVPYRVIAVSAEVAGRVVQMSEDCRSGRFVTAGQTLVTIDPQTYEIEKKRLAAEVRSAQSSLAELDVQIKNAEDSVRLAAADVKLAQSETQRQQDLRSSGGGGTVTAVEQARRAELQAKDKLQSAANQVRTLRSQRERLEIQKELAATDSERAELDLARTAVTSPVSGVIVATDVEQDGYVRAGDPLFTVDDSSRAEVRTNLRMKTLAWVIAHPPAGTEPNPRGSNADGSGGAAAGGAYALPQIPVTVEYELLGNIYTWNGTLSRVEGAGLDERTRTVPCRVVVDDPRAVSMRAGAGEVPVAGPRALVRGMYVTVSLHTDPTDPLLEIPEQALRPGNRVWVVRDGALEILTVPVATIVNGTVLVPPGGGTLHAGDRLVTTPLPAAVPGMKVRVAGDEPARPEPAGTAAADVPADPGAV